jgi:hypothetical protein
MDWLWKVDGEQLQPIIYHIASDCGAVAGKHIARQSKEVFGSARPRSRCLLLI